MTSISYSSEEELENKDLKPYHYFEQQVMRRVHHYYLSQEIDEPIRYGEMIHQIQTAGPESIIYIHLNTPGGVLDTGVQLINSIRISEAHIVCSLEGYVASLGTLIFLAADEFIVHDISQMMFHNYSGGVGGKGHEQIAALEAATRWTQDIMKDLYIPFLSEDEFDRIMLGEDLYFQADEIRRRLEKMVKVLEKERKELEQGTAKPKAARPKRKRGTTKKS